MSKITFEKFEDHKPIDDTIGFPDTYVRDDYGLHLVGTFESPIGPRREAKPEDFEVYGDWTPCNQPPEKPGFYLLHGHYINDDGDWPDAILPAWFHECQEWDVSYGGFEEVKGWMHIPWIPELWEFVEKRFAERHPNLAAAKRIQP